MKRENLLALVMTGVILTINLAYIIAWSNTPDCTGTSLAMVLLAGNSIMISGWYTLDKSINN